MSAVDLAGKVVVVSGTGPGLGRSTALACARAGAAVVVAARTPPRVDALVDELRAAGSEALGVVADITDAQARADLVEQSIGRFGRVDGLVNNAFAMGPMATHRELTPEEWRQVLEVNVVATVALTSAFAVAMCEAGRGSVVMVGSQAARRGAARRGPYAASKAALLAAAQVLATELGPAGVRVNTVVPGQIWGDALEAHYAQIATRRGVDPDEVVAQVAKDIPLRRITRPEEIAEAVVFLVSDRASAITGQALDVNGGNWFA